MGKFEFNDIEKQLAKEISNGIKKDMTEWIKKNDDPLVKNRPFESFEEMIKIQYYLIARFVLERLEKEI